MTETELRLDDTLQPVDYLMLRGEADPRSRSSMLSVALLDTVPAFDTLLDVFDRASRRCARLRQHVVVPTLPVADPRWIVDPDFDLDYHLRRVCVPGPGSLREVLDLAQRIMAAPLDTTRPLWEVTLVEGVAEDGCPAALIMKLHHSVTDGVGGLQLFKALYDLERDVERGPSPLLPIPEEVSGTDLVRRELAASIGNLLPGAKRRLGQGLRLGRDVLRGPKHSLQALRDMLASARRVLGPPPTEPSPLLRRRSLGRHLDTLEFPLKEFRQAAKSAGVSVNDAYIAALCGGLRRYHEAMGVEIDSLPLAMPVNLRRDDDPAGGNRFAGARLAVPIAEKDPVRRMQRIRELVITAVEEPAIDILTTVAPVLSRLPAPMLGALSAAAASTDVQASNVPGYPETPFIAGARIVRMYPFGPLPGVAMMIVLLSQAGECYLGIHCDTASVTDPARLRQCLQEGIDEVLESVA